MDYWKAPEAGMGSFADGQGPVQDEACSSWGPEGSSALLKDSCTRQGHPRAILPPPHTAFQEASILAPPAPNDSPA